jgi:hypothetical protein
LEWSRCSGETIVGPCWGDVQLVDSIDGNAVYACEGHACRYDLGSARKDYTPPPKDYTPPFYDEFHDATVVPWPKPGPDDFRLDEAGVELAAREICRQKGLNPDERIDYPASNCDMLNIGPRWRSIVDRFKDFEAFTLALEEARRKRGF